MKKRYLAMVLGIVIMTSSVMTTCIASEPEAGTEAVQNQELEEPASQAADAEQEEEPEVAAEEVPAPAEEAFEDSSPEIVEESADELEQEEEDDALNADAEAEKAVAEADAKAKNFELSENADDPEGLIEDDGTVTSDSIEGDPEMSLDEMWDDQMHNRMFPGFEVDPTKYPPANITVNTVTVYRFLTRQMKLNHAAACGVLANIQLESNFRPLALGDSGTSYGICQWHNGRFSSLMSYCKSHDLDYNTLKGQLAYLEWDLTHGYKDVYQMLLKMKDTEEGAYQAGYLFCYHFEIPDQVAARSVRRGNLARDEYFDKDFDQLEWELRHSELVFGKDQLEMLETLDEVTWQVPAAWTSSGEETADSQEGEAAPAELPEWQSALGELSLLF